MISKGDFEKVEWGALECEYMRIIYSTTDYSYEHY